MLNVPTVVWIDEDDRVVRPPDMGYGDNTWKDFTGVDAAEHHDELRRWVRDGENDHDADFVRSHRLRSSAEEQQARVERRLGAWLKRAGHDAAAQARFDRAAELAPFDWTVRRGTMPLRDVDPFGEKFFAFLGEWMEAGAPSYGWGNSARVPGS